MANKGLRITNRSGSHFITFAVVGWVDVFTKQNYRDILLESLRYCQRERGLIIHAWCLMSNHIHLIVTAKKNDTSEIMRDFKKFTSNNIISAIANNPRERRKEWMLAIFRMQGERNSRNQQYQFWQQELYPIELFSNKFFGQKKDYIHNNPVKAKIVESPESYLLSSARDYTYGKGCGLLEVDLI